MPSTAAITVVPSTTSHRAVTVPDLLVAATAEASGLTVLHYDRDFDLIASITGQRCEWVAPAGTLD